MIALNDRTRAIGMILLATIFWGLSFPLSKALWIHQSTHLVPGASSWFLSAVVIIARFGVGGLIFALAFARSFEKLTRLEIEQAAGLGVFAAAGLILQMDGLNHTSASTSAFLTQCYCLIIPLYKCWVWRKWPSWRLLFSCLMAAIGVGILSGFSFATLSLGRGEAETILCSIVFTGQILWLERPKYRGNHIGRVTTLMFLLIALLMMPVAAFSSVRPTEDFFASLASGPAWLVLSALIVLCTLVAFGLMNLYQPKIDATEAGLMYCIEPIFASLFALFLPLWLSQLLDSHYANEEIHTNLLIGGGLVTAANLILLTAAKEIEEEGPPPVDAA